MTVFFVKYKDPEDGNLHPITKEEMRSHLERNYRDVALSLAALADGPLPGNFAWYGQLEL